MDVLDDVFGVVTKVVDVEIPVDPSKDVSEDVFVDVSDDMLDDAVDDKLEFISSDAVEVVSLDTVDDLFTVVSKLEVVVAVTFVSGKA